MHRHRIRIQRTCCTCSSLLYMCDDIILRTISQCRTRSLFLILKSIIKYYLPRSVPTLNFLLCRSIKLIPISFVLRLPISKFLYSVIVLCTRGKETCRKHHPAQAEDTCSTTNKHLYFLCHSLLFKSERDRGVGLLETIENLDTLLDSKKPTLLSFF